MDVQPGLLADCFLTLSLGCLGPWLVGSLSKEMNTYPLTLSVAVLFAHRWTDVVPSARCKLVSFGRIGGTASCADCMGIFIEGAKREIWKLYGKNPTRDQARCNMQGLPSGVVYEQIDINEAHPTPCLTTSKEQRDSPAQTSDSSLRLTLRRPSEQKRRKYRCACLVRLVYRKR